MARYDFRCTTCNKIEEIECPISQFDEIEPVTHYKTLAFGRVVCGLMRRVYRPVGVVLKGSGFYRNDLKGK